jgi:hypothetical protein
MHADAYFARGHGHLVGQDYALASAPGAASAWAVVCDGCSGSPHADVGARALAHAAALALDRAQTPSTMTGLVRRATAVVRALGLPTTSVDATCLIVREVGDRIEATMHGDGVLAWCDRDGHVHVRTVEYPSGAPAYGSYLLDVPRGDAWREAEADHWVLRRRSGEAPWQVEGRGRGVVAPFEFDRAALRWLLVASDGLCAVSEPDGRGGRRPVGADLVVAELTDFASLTGRYLARRGHRLHTRIADARGWRLHDDVSFAGLMMEGLR